ncbi:Six-hairpin glycosidase-like protein [Aspergillus pseudoustus]|uniref:Six-hairpin glycosidase-like protein n=1 Tax=Aspergillus pseudoustus TaxID=1810923 RepID=A0ABR4K8P1_9EURO
MADSVIQRGQAVLENQEDSSSLLQVGAFQTALLDLLDTPSARYLEQDWESYLTRSGDSVVGVVGNATQDTRFPLDRLSVGKGLVYLYDKTGDGTYRDALSALRASIDLQPRNQWGGLWYYVYPNWSYLDGMFSLISFYPLYTAHFDTDNTTTEAAVSTDLFNQLDLLWTHCHDTESTLLLFHGYDATKTAIWADPVTGASPFVWGRALGWFIMGLVDFLEFAFTHEPGYAGFEAQLATWRSRFVALCDALVDAADPVSGAWWQVLSAPGREGNYIESSASAMFSYVLFKGVRIGLFKETEGNTLYARGASPAETYTGVAARAYRALMDRFVVDNADGSLSYNGTVGVCSLNSTATYEYYVTRPLVYDSVLGSAAFIRASTEYELWHGSH